LLQPPDAAYDPLFDDAWVKFQWAAAQGEMLKRGVERANELDVEPGLVAEQEFHPEFHGFSIYITAVPANPTAWGLLLGDVIHAYRSALDYAAWAAVQRGSQPPTTLTEVQRRKVAFPCCETSWKDFRKSMRKHAPGVTGADRTAIQWIQPYSFSERRRRRHILPALVDYDNVHKHKAIQPVLRRSADFTVEVVNPTDCIVRRVRLMDNVALEVGAEIARIYVRRTGPDPDIEVKGQLSTGVAVNDRFWIGNFLDEARRAVGSVLRKFSEAPSDLTERISFGD